MHLLMNLKNYSCLRVELKEEELLDEEIEQLIEKRIQAVKTVIFNCLMKFVIN